MTPFGIGIPSLIIIILLFLIIFGPNKLPQAGRSLGLALREFKNSTSNLISDDESKDKVKNDDDIEGKH